jgi:hypothetical protein
MKPFEFPEIEIIELTIADVINTSIPELDDDDLGEWN